MGQVLWNVDVDENTKLYIRSDGMVVVIRTEVKTFSDLPPEYLVRVAEEFNKRR